MDVCDLCTAKDGRRVDCILLFPRIVTDICMASVVRSQRLYAIPAEGHRPHHHIAGCDAGPVGNRRQLSEKAGGGVQEHAASLLHVSAVHRGEQSGDDGAASRGRRWRGKPAPCASRIPHIEEEAAGAGSGGGRVRSAGPESENSSKKIWAEGFRPLKDSFNAHEYICMYLTRNTYCKNVYEQPHLRFK